MGDRSFEGVVLRVEASWRQIWILSMGMFGPTRELAPVRVRSDAALGAVVHQARVASRRDRCGG